jgi:polyisoprenoid-binding protein YceI
MMRKEIHGVLKCKVSMILRSVLFLGVSSVSSILYAEKIYLVDPNTSQLEFTAIGKPGFIRINGKGARIEGQAKIEKEETVGSFSTKLDHFVTGIETRDQHMRDAYLQTKEFPNARLDWKIDAVTVDKVRQEIPFTGTLELHGVKRPIEGLAMLTISSDGLKVDGEAQFKIKLSDYKITIPKYLGIVVAEEVSIKANFTAGKTTSP